MKTIAKLTLVLFVLVTFQNCSKDDAPTPEPIAQPEPIPEPENAAPVINTQTFTVAENSADNIPIGEVEASDADNDSLTFSISSNDGNLFEISETGSLSLDDQQTLDFETAQSHSITVAVSDGKTSKEAEITITVTDIDDTSFVTTWETSIANETVTIPTRADEYTYDYTIDWGDGTTQSGRTGDANHTYVNTGLYTVIISGTFPAIVLEGNFAARDQLRNIEQWGNIQWQTMDRAFTSISSLSITATDVPDLSEVTSMSLMFVGANILNGDFNFWDVSNVMNMESMFAGSQFNQDISDWNVGNVTNMDSMFELSSFNGDISEWTLSNVTDMEEMFRDSQFNQNIDDWNVGNVTTMNFMFENSQFNKDIKDWNVSNVTSMIKMFENSLFNRDISAWDVDNIIFCSSFAINSPLTVENTPNFTNCSP